MRVSSIPLSFLILCEGMWLHLHGKTIVICAKKLFCCIWFFCTTLRVNRIKPVWTKFKFISYIKWDFIYYTFKYCSISRWCSSFVCGCCDSFLTIHIADFFAIEIEYRENYFLYKKNYRNNSESYPISRKDKFLNLFLLPIF